MKCTILSVLYCINEYLDTNVFRELFEARLGVTGEALRLVQIKLEAEGIKNS